MWPSPSRLRQWWLNRLPCETSCTLTQRRIYLLPTRFGWTLLLVAAAIWLGALNYSVSLAYALAFWLVALLLVAVLMAYRQLVSLQLTPQSSEPVFAGGEHAVHAADQGHTRPWPGHLAGTGDAAGW
ncbi:hypothetical protein [Paludibacterium denitrificans]|uniref:DUF58 domain-containing protein n=1 Tax=Paludibacterium denitrificans TaxID=2675226 RepID=A0A844GC07_9NEIS|nr:hypothetical protein [Paludibacterium denitrificans]MTD32831.1 hypothetical protein [Paludibacterium denitrificans]